jgi:GTPase SAR1 family protein
MYTPFILVATKIDLYNDDYTNKRLKNNNKTFVTKEEGIIAAKKINAIAFFETSSRTGEGLNGKIILIS